MAIFKPIQTTTRSQHVFVNIKEAIFGGKLEPGAPLRELQLAQEFQLSQSTIREALFQLEQVGLVVKVPHKGTSVIKLSAKEITDRLTIRFYLEELAYIQAAENMTDKDYKALYKIMDEISQAVKKESYYNLINADLSFHRFIWEKSGNQVLYNVLNQISVPLFAYISLEHHTKEHDISKVVMSHENYIQALKSRDVNTIRKSIQKVATHSYQQFIPKRKKYFY